MRHATRPTEPAWLQAVIENPHSARTPLTSFAELEKRLASASRALERTGLMGEQRCLLIEEIRILRQNLAARPFDLRTARLCDRKLDWLAQRAKQLGSQATSTVVATTLCA
jgi:hypothetical protein